MENNNNKIKQLKGNNNDNDLFLQSSFSTTIIFKIIQDLKNNVFNMNTTHLNDPKNKRKNLYPLEPWEEEFIRDNHTDIVRTYNASEFGDQYNLETIMQSLEFLQEFKKGVYSFKNSKGRTISTSGGLLVNYWFEEESQDFSIIISPYWANKLESLSNVDLNKLYDEILLY